MVRRVQKSGHNDERTKRWELSDNDLDRAADYVSEISQVGARAYDGPVKAGHRPFNQLLSILLILSILSPRSRSNSW